MTWQEALEILADHPHIVPFRINCADDFPGDRDGYRRLVVDLAQGNWPPIESPDQIIARVEAMAARANAGERRGGCGGCP